MDVTGRQIGCILELKIMFLLYKTGFNLKLAFEKHVLSNRFTFTYPLTAGVIGAPQMTSQPVSSIVLYSALPSGTWWPPGLYAPCCCLPTSSSICLAFFPLSSCSLISCWILAWTYSLVTWSSDEMHSILRQHLISMAHILLCSSAVTVHDTYAHRKMDVTRERISCIFGVSNR